MTFVATLRIYGIASRNFINTNMGQTAAMLENIGNTITRLTMDQLGRNLGGRIPSRSRHVRDDAVAIETAVA